MPAIASWSRVEQWASSHVTPLPTGVAAGDLLLWLVSSPSEISSVSSGWTLVHSAVAGPDPYGRIEGRVYVRVATGSDTAPSFATAAAINASHAILRVTGAAAVVAVHQDGVTALTSAASGVDAPSLTPSVSDTLAVSIAYAYYRLHTASPSGYTELFAPDLWADAGGNGFLRVAHAAGPASGVATGAKNWPCAASSLYQVASHLLIAPAGQALAGASATAAVGDVTGGLVVQLLAGVVAAATLGGVSGVQSNLVDGISATATIGDVTGTVNDGAIVGGITVTATPGVVDGVAPLYARQPGELYLQVLRIDHPAIGSIRLVADSHPLMIGADVYTPWPLAATFPARHEIAGEAQIDVCAVDRSILAALHQASASEPATVWIAAVDAVRPDDVLASARGVLRGVSVQAETATLRIGHIALIEDEPISITFTPGRFQGLFSG